MATPRRRSSGSRSGSKRKRSSKSKRPKNNNGLMLGLAIGGGIVTVVAAVVIGVIIGRGSNSSDEPANVADNTPAQPPVVAETDTDSVSPYEDSSRPTERVNFPVSGPPASNEPANTQNMPQTVNTESPAESLPGSGLVETSMPSTPAKPEKMDLPTLIEKVEKSIVRILVKSEQGESLGSGFVIDANGTFVTNYHVIEGAVTAKAEFSDGSSFPIEGFYKLDDKRDLAILKIDPGDKVLTALSIADELPRQGISVATFGAPRGLSFSNSDGIVSGLRTAEELKQNGDGQYVQTTAAISGGNSGGPLVNMYGEVVGANTFKRLDGESLNFAISCVDIKDMVDNRGTELTAVSPENIPVKIAGGSGKYGGAEDLTGTEKGNIMLSQIREAIIITAPFNYDRTGRITDYVVASAERTFKDRLKWKSIRRSSEVKGSSALVFVAIYFSLNDEADRNFVTDLNVHTVVVARDIDKDGNEFRAIVLNEEGVVGTASIRTLYEGILSRTMEKGTRSYFSKLVGQYRKATRYIGG